jgi:hypothetical protein
MVRKVRRIITALLSSNNMLINQFYMLSTGRKNFPSEGAGRAAGSAEAAQAAGGGQFGKGRAGAYQCSARGFKRVFSWGIASAAVIVGEHPVRTFGLRGTEESSRAASVLSFS